DPKVEAITEALPGANCGGCGYPGCGANAEAIAAGKSSPSSCVAGGTEVAIEIARIMGVSVQAKEPDVARMGCYYGVQDADLKYIYDGVADCRAAAILNGGSKECPIGCLGLGTCVNSCPFNALSMGPENLPVVNLSLCTGCGTCERVCPKHIITLTSYSRRIQHEFTTDECSAPCQRACPAGIDIPAYINRISRGLYLDAVRIIKETNPFPLVCGRICIRPCEYVCRRNLIDEPVAINNLKRFAADYEMRSGTRVHNPRAPETGKRIAVAGGGAEGLTAAYLLNRLGHDSVVYESTSQLGGLLRAGIQQNRLPKAVLDWEIEGIMDAGVQAILNTRVGMDVTVGSLLKDGFDGVFISTGGWDTFLREKGESDSYPVSPMPGVRLLIDFLVKSRAGKIQNIGKHIAILGGGRATLEAASACIKAGAEEVSVIVRSSINDASFSDEEIKNAEGQGVTFRFSTVITGMKGESDRLTHIEILTPADTGDTVENSIIPVDAVLVGAGRFPEMIYVPVKDEEGETQAEEKIKWRTIYPYAGPFAEQDEGIFRPGEEGSDYEAVVEAIGAGRRAAASMQRYIDGEPVKTPANMIRKDTYVLTLNKLEPVPKLTRSRMPESEMEKRINDPDLEISAGYSEEEAVKEAKRCMKCGLICYRRSKDY
ncbi:MAG: FAD-dependent oxidoreductase, partial [Deltaproteobacteria bacterium]|nr:FAD-dependent oxidoreductase [Deltaproteobacteria bacterium]